MAGLMGYAFISYSHKDGDYVRRLQEKLDQEGFEVWVDERINYGDEWTRVVQKHLDECAVFIVVISRNAEESDWVLSELARAKRKKKPIFPLLLEGEPWLTFEAINYEDVSGGRMPPRKFYDRLSEKVKGQKKAPVPTRTPAPIPEHEAARKYYQEGRRLAEQNRFGIAIENYRIAIEKDPGYASAWGNMGVLLKEQKRLQEAEKAFREAIRLDPQDGYSTFYLGVLLSEKKPRQGQPEQEGMDEAACREALRANPGEVSALNRLGTLLEKQGRVKEAEEAFKWAILGGGAETEAIYHLGWLLVEQKRYAEAEKAFRAVIEKEPEDAEAWYGLGEALFHLGQYEKSKQMYDRAKSIY